MILLQLEWSCCRNDHAEFKQGTGLSEAIATLEGETKHLRAEKTRLENDNKGAYNQIRAKDKELDTMAMEIEAAHQILIQNGVSIATRVRRRNIVLSWQNLFDQNSRKRDCKCSNASDTLGFRILVMFFLGELPFQSIKRLFHWHQDCVGLCPEFQPIFQHGRRYSS